MRRPPPRAKERATYAQWVAAISHNGFGRYAGVDGRPASQ
jgi:hypothetical protein